MGCSQVKSAEVSEAIGPVSQKSASATPPPPQNKSLDAASLPFFGSDATPIIVNPVSTPIMQATSPVAASASVPGAVKSSKDQAVSLEDFSFSFDDALLGNLSVRSSLDKHKRGSGKLMKDVMGERRDTMSDVSTGFGNFSSDDGAGSTAHSCPRSTCSKVDSTEYLCLHGHIMKFMGNSLWASNSRGDDWFCTWGDCENCSRETPWIGRYYCSQCQYSFCGNCAHFLRANPAEREAGHQENLNAMVDSFAEMPAVASLSSGSPPMLGVGTPAPLKSQQEPAAVTFKAGRGLVITITKSTVETYPVEEGWYSEDQGAFPSRSRSGDSLASDDECEYGEGRSSWRICT